MATATSNGVNRRALRAVKGTQQNKSAASAKSIEETLSDFYEAMALAVEHPDCPPSLAFQIHEFIREVTDAAHGVSQSAVQAAKVRTLLPAMVSILARGDQALGALKAT